MTAQAELPLVEPGVYPLSLEQYHADPLKPIGGSLSSSGARRLMPPGCPALFRYEQDNPQPPKKVFDIGTAAHKLVLGDGPELVIVDALRWDTTAIKAKVTAIRADGKVPLKRAEHEQVHAMAAALRAHPIASRLLEPGSGEPEQSLLWQDPGTGVWRRARPDWIRPDAVIDYKTTTKAEPLALQKTIYEYGYHAQADWCLDGARTLGLTGDHAPFYLIFQEKNAPHIVTVVRPDYTALRIGHDLNQTALHLYAMCRETGHWPGYSEQVELISLPTWVERLYT